MLTNPGMIPPHHGAVRPWPIYHCAGKPELLQVLDEQR